MPGASGVKEATGENWSACDTGAEVLWLDDGRASTDHAKRADMLSVRGTPLVTFTRVAPRDTAGNAPEESPQLNATDRLLAHGTTAHGGGHTTVTATAAARRSCDPALRRIENTRELTSVVKGLAAIGCGCLERVDAGYGRLKTRSAVRNGHKVDNGGRRTGECRSCKAEQADMPTLRSRRK